MGVWRLVLREIGHRRLNFTMAALSVLVAVGTFVGAVTLLGTHQRRTDRELAALENDYRKITLKLGFNVLILPRDQNLADLYADDYAAKTLPEDYVKRLSNSRIMTINHVLPVLQRKLRWPEYERTILLIGTRGEVPLLARSPEQKPMLHPVAPGTIVLGSELHRSLKLKTGDRVKLMGAEFTVAKCLEERGSKDDITAWIDLAQAQELLGQHGRINAILALSCQCEGERLPGIRAEIEKVLPDTQVIEYASQAIARAEARTRAAEHARATLGALRALAGVLVPVVMVGCAAAIAVLVFLNVRDRRIEIGILRALGMGSAGVLGIFLLRAALIGVLGAAAGYFAGLLAASAFADAPFDPMLLAVVFVMAPVLATVASWVPALIASRQDPALALQEE